MASKTRPCERCGAMIPPERIEVLPETRLCVACSKAVGGEFCNHHVLHAYALTQFVYRKIYICLG